jgi:hypothetical protein
VPDGGLCAEKWMSGVLSYSRIFYRRPVLCIELFFIDAEPLKTEVLKFENSSENFTHWKIAMKTGRFSYRAK